MALIANRDCIVCGSQPPYDEWILVVPSCEELEARKLPRGSFRGHSGRWIHGECLEVLLGYAKDAQREYNRGRRVKKEKEVKKLPI